MLHACKKILVHLKDTDYLRTHDKDFTDFYTSAQVNNATSTIIISGAKIKLSEPVTAAFEVQFSLVES